MKVFLDEDVPRKLTRFLSRPRQRNGCHHAMGLDQNGPLLALIEREGFEVFITGDKNIRSQQQLVGRTFAVLIMSAINWPIVRPHVGKIAAAVVAAQPGTVTLVDCGGFGPPSRSGGLRPRYW